MKKISLTKKRKKTLMGLTLACMLALTLAPRPAAADDWKASFEAVCSKVDASGTLSVKELESLVEQADKLMPEIQRSDDPSKKVYLQRLKKCRSMYEFAIEMKKEPDK